MRIFFTDPERKFRASKWKTIFHGEILLRIWGIKGRLYWPACQKETIHQRWRAAKTGTPFTITGHFLHHHRTLFSPSPDTFYTMRGHFLPHHRTIFLHQGDSLFTSSAGNFYTRYSLPHHRTSLVNHQILFAHHLRSLVNHNILFAPSPDIPCKSPDTLCPSPYIPCKSPDTFCPITGHPL